MVEGRPASGRVPDAGRLRLTAPPAGALGLRDGRRPGAAGGWVGGCGLPSRPPTTQAKPSRPPPGAASARPVTSRPAATVAAPAPARSPTGGSTADGMTDNHLTSLRYYPLMVEVSVNIPDPDGNEPYIFMRQSPVACGATFELPDGRRVKAIHMNEELDGNTHQVTKQRISVQLF